jgi:hypothetical protein
MCLFRYSYCRELITLDYSQREESRGKIGGPTSVVQCDESKFGINSINAYNYIQINLGKRKFNRGRRIEGHWVLGMIEDGSEDFRLVVCPENVRSADTLLPIIEKHVEIGIILIALYRTAYK